MKIILSRKGFDGTAGGVPSPIMPDGTLLSLPIPAKMDKLRYSDIQYEGVSYSEILRQLKPKDSKIGNWNCHLDPDIRDGVRVDNINEWKSIFGQCDTAQSYLKNQQVDLGDLFLFFGWFKQTEGNLHDGTLRYVKKAPNLHIIFGYLQVGEIIIDNVQIKNNYSWHPHSFNHFINKKCNALYLSTDFLSFDNRKKGYGTFKFSEEKILTLSGKTRATWKEISALLPDNISRNVKNSAKNEGIYYSGQWQELVLKETAISEKWAKSLF